MSMQNRKSSGISIKKNNVSLNNQPMATIGDDDARKNKYYNNVSNLEPPLLSDYDFVAELLQSKMSKFNSNDDNNNFTLTKDSLTLISTKLNVIKEEEISFSPVDMKTMIPKNNSKGILSNKKHELREDILDEENFQYTTCPSSPCKNISLTNMDSFSETSELLLSCNVSDETLTENMSFVNQDDVLEMLLNMNDYFKPLHNKRSNYILDELTRFQNGIQNNRINILMISRSQQTLNARKNKLGINTPRKGSPTKVNKNISKIKKISQENPIFDKPELKVNTYVKKQNVTNRGDFLNVKAKPRRYNTFEQNKKSTTEVTNKCFVYLPRVKNQLMNAVKLANVTNTSSLARKRKIALTNMVIEYPKENENNSSIYKVRTRNKNNISNEPKNLNINPFKNQPKRRLIGMTKDKRRETSIKMGYPMKQFQLSTFELGAKSCKTDATTKSVMKIVLKKIESKDDSESNSRTCHSKTDVNKSEKSNSKVFDNDSSLFFTNAYTIFKEHKHLATVNNLDNENSYSSTCNTHSKIKFKLSNDQSKLYLLSEKTNSVSNPENYFYEKTEAVVPSEKNRENISSSDCRQSDIVTIYSKMSDEEEIRSVYSSLVHSKSFTKTVSLHKRSSLHLLEVANDEINLSTCSIRNKAVNSVPKIAQRRQTDSTATKDAIVNTIITMKKNNEIIKLKTSLDLVDNISNIDEVKYGNVTENLENMLKCFVRSKCSNAELNTLSPGSSFTLYSPRTHGSPITNKAISENNYLGSELLDTRHYSSEQFIREISNNSPSNSYPLSVSSQQFENNKPIEMVLTNINEECSTSLNENNINYRAPKVINPVSLSEVDSIETFSSKRLTLSESPKFCKKYTNNNTTEKIIQRIKKLPFIGYECEWQRCTNDMWQFKLLNGRLFLILRLDTREEPNLKVESERRIISIGLHKYVIHRKRNNLSEYCVKFVGDSIRYFIATKKWDRIGQVPCLLAKCCTIARLGEKWEQDMRDTKIRLGYELDNNGLLSMQVANHSGGSTMCYVTMRVELQKDSYRSYPEAKDIRFKQVVGNRPFTRSDLITKLRQINLDWDHVLNTLWTINDYLRHNKQGMLSKITSYRCFHQNPGRTVQNTTDQHTAAHNRVQNIYQPRSSSPCPYSPFFMY